MNHYLTLFFVIAVMAIDNKERVQKILGLDNEAFIIAKPPPILDLQNLWQFILSMRMTEPIDRNNRRKKVTNKVGGQNATRPPKKRLVWTPKLHRKFLDSIRLLSFNSKYFNSLVLVNEFASLPDFHGIFGCWLLY